MGCTVCGTLKNRTTVCFLGGIEYSKKIRTTVQPSTANSSSYQPNRQATDGIYIIPSVCLAHNKYAKIGGIFYEAE